MCVVWYYLAEKFTFSKETGQKEGGGRKGINFIAKFGCYVSIRGACEDPDKNIS
jgi:hypothetical protein